MDMIRILIVEDEEIIAKDLAFTLIEWGYSVIDAVKTGERAIEVATTNKPNIILMDITLQGEMDGIETTRRIQEILDIPVIYLTAYMSDDLMKRARKTEPFAYIVKPIIERVLQIQIEIALFKHQTEMETREKFQLLSKTLSSIGDGVISTDEKGLLTYMNPIAERIIKMDTAQVINKKIEDILSFFNEKDKSLSENPIHSVIKKKKEIRSVCHTMIINHLKVKLPVNFCASPLKGNKNQIIGVVLVFSDITEIIKTEEALRISEENYRRLYENALVGIFRFILDLGNFRFANDAMWAILGFSPDEIRNIQTSNARDIRFYQFINQSKIDQFIQRLQKDKYITNFELEIIRKDHQVIRSLMMARLLPNTNEIEGIMIDLTSLIQGYHDHINEKEATIRSLEHTIESWKKQETSFESIIGKSKKMKNVFQLITDAGKTDASVLITGETGTGKELVARAIHQVGLRNDKPFVAINCGALPENLIESELFGFEKGAFTGALKRKIGKFEYAHEGTLFLDEIGELTPNLQVKLLRVLQEKIITPLGSNQAIQVDVRIIAATNRNLNQMISENKFREDIYYRLNVIPIHFPPLRESKEDIIPLTHFFINKYNLFYHKGIEAIDANFHNFLMTNPWKGNVRELENVIERTVVLSKSNILSHKESPQPMMHTDNNHSYHYNLVDSLKTNLEKFERTLIQTTFAKNNHNIKLSAKELGIGLKTLYRKLKNYSISVPRK